jgi:spermidine synthase
MPDNSETDAEAYATEWEAISVGREYASIGDIDGLSGADIRFLGRLGFWPDYSQRQDVPDGTPYVSDVGKYRSLHFDWSAVQSEMSRDDPLALTVDYTRIMMGFLLFNPAPLRIEMIGLGGGSLAKLCYHLLPTAEITVVEIDPDVIALRERFLVPPDNQRFRVVVADGANYVRRLGPAADVLLVDGFDADGQPPQLCSSYFYSNCYHRLAPGGLMIVNLWGGDPNNRKYLAKMRRSFGNDPLVIATEGDTNKAIFCRKNLDIDLADAAVANVATAFPQRQAQFLTATGRRIQRAIARRSERKSPMTAFSDELKKRCGVKPAR